MEHSFNARDFIPLHASAVYNADGALLFLGPSGTGKSTMWRMLSAYMSPSDEDLVFLVHLANEWLIVSGGQWKHRSIERITVEGESIAYTPLRAVFRLYQDIQPRLERIGSLWTCRYLTNAFLDILSQRKRPLASKQHTFMNLASIARSLLGYVFYFDLSTRTLETLNSEMDLW